MAEEQAATYSEEFAQHVKNAGKSILKQWGSLIPNDFWVYGRDATREMLLAMRTVIDGAIDVVDPDTETSPKPARKKAAGKKKIDIED